eukprot:COSAG01_NODE_8210_length_2874_cov_1.873514_2_plen_110_part_00
MHGASIGGGGGGGGGGVVPLVMEGAPPPPSRGAGRVLTTSSAVGPGSPGFRAKVGWLYRKGDAADGAGLGGAAAVASFSAAVLTEIYLCNVCSCPKMLRRNGRGQAGAR